jgi:filamentous hemagglutinin family protein
MSERSILSRGLELRPTRRLTDGRIWSALIAAVCVAAAPAFAGDVLPSNGTVTAGSASIVRTNPSTLNINQGTNQAIINWNSFSVGHGDTVNFNQPGTSSATLNRVTGTTPSWIAGTINAPGTVLLVNPNGIAITKSGTVHTGSFVGSTLDIKDADFLAGRYKFSGNGASAGVINNGHINVSDGGFAALLGGQVSNNGVIAARLGKVGLGAGEQATLDLSGDGFLSVTVPSSELGHMTRADGALVSNKGKINADGGTVFLSAATASNILRNAVNMGGTIRANSVGTHDGRIVINGGGGNVNITGKMLAKSRTGTGGEVDITSAGAGVKLVGALIDVSGKTGGGVVNIGGGPHATVALADAGSVSLDSTTAIRADAIDNGDGGHIVIWSGGQTTATGNFSAKGGRNGGNGGLVETSGRSVDFNNIVVNASAAKGAAGTWLVDPTDLTIDSAAATTIGNMLGNGTNVWLQTNADGSTSGPGNTSAGNGDIVINSHITWNSGAGSTLFLQSAHDIDINAGICCGSLNMSAVGSVNSASTSSIDTSGTTITAGGNITINGFVILAGATSFSAGGDIVITTQATLGNDPTLTAGGNIQVNLATTTGGMNLSAFGNISLGGMQNSAGGTITLRSDNDGTGSGTVSISGFAQAGGANVNIYYNPTSYTSPTNYSSMLNGAGTVTAYMLVNSVGQLEAITNAATGTYAMARDIDASNFNFIPIGWRTGGATPNNFRGVFDGQGHVITNVAIGTLPLADVYYGGQTGLFWENDGTIRNLGVTGNLTTGLNTWAGGLAGVNGGTIFNSWSGVNVTGIADDASTGGLVGVNFRTIDGGSYSTGTVIGSNYVGGLVGENRAGATIQDSYSSASVNGPTAGGLVGINRTGALINYTYAVGPVHGSSYTGGLVGENEQSIAAYGTIENSYAAGHLSGASVGGLVGFNGYPQSENQDDFNSQIGQSAKVFWSYWDADTTGTTKAFGTSYYDRPGYSSENVQYIAFLSTDPTKGPGLGGVVNAGSPYSQASYKYFYDPTPETNGEYLPSGLFVTYSGETDTTTFTAHWYMVEGSTRPFLVAEESNTIQNAHQLQLIAANPTGNYALARNITYANDGMWTSAGFAPIAPVVETDTYAPYIPYDLICGCFAANPLAIFYIYNPTAANFTGSLNGNGYTISNLTETVTNGNGGLFSMIGAGGYVTSLGLVNPQITANNYGTASGGVGALAGYNAGTITGTWATGGQIVGNFALDIGGLVGNNFNTGTVTQSYTNLSVIGANQPGAPNYNLFLDNDGGLVGTNHGVITDSYAVGSVLGNGAVGGLVGYSDGLITRTYSTGVIGNNYNYGIKNPGALIGNNEGSLYESFWDSTTATYKTGGLFVDPSIGLTTARLQNLDTYSSVYAGWDFNHVWAPPNQVGQGGLGTAYYPQLYADTAVVFVDADSASMTYGQSTPSLATGIAGGPGVYRFGASPDSLTAPGTSTSASSTSNVGSYAVTANVGSTVTSRLGVTYRVVQKTGTVTVTPAILSVTPNGGSSTYNDTALNNTAYSDNASNYSISGFVDGQTASSIGVSFTGSMAFNGSTGTSVLNAGTYSLSQGTLAVNSTNSNYVISFSNPTPNTYVVNPATLTYTANSASMSYGGTAGTLTGTLAGFIGNDTIANSTTGSLAFLTSAGSLSNVGNYAINGSGLTLTNPNYTFAQASSNAAAFTITKAVLTVTGDKTYDAGSGFTTSQLAVMGGVNGQTITLKAGTGTSGSANAGTYAGSSLSGLTISVTGGAGNDLASNFQLPPTGTLTIDKANYTSLSGSKTYDGNTSFSGSQIVLTGIGGQTFTVVSGTSNAANASLNPNSPSQSFVSISGPITGNGTADPNNYVFNIASLQGNVANIDKANYVSLTGSKTYDGNTGFTQLTFAGVNNETFTVASATSDYANASTNPNSPAAHFVNISGIAGNGVADPNNYAAPLNLGAGTLTTNMATINVASYTAITGTKTYDGNADFASGLVTLTGVNNETFNVAATSDSPNARLNPNAPSTKFVSTSGAITGVGLADPNNYAPLVVANLTDLNNVATINQANYTSLTGSKTYDGNTGFTSSQLALTGVNGETFTVASATSDYANASTNPNNPVGHFVSLSGITGNNGADPNNYVAPLNLGKGSLTTNTATIGVAGYTAIAGTKTYDGTADFTSTQVTLSGVNGETFTVAAMSNSANASTNPSNPSTSFVSTSGPISGNGGADTNNYAPLVVASLAGANNVANINAASLTLTGLKTYDGTTAFLASAFGNNGTIATGINGETLILTGSGLVLSPNVSAGTQALALGTLKFTDGTGLARNYAIATNGNTGTINPASIVVTANSGSSIYGSTPASPGLSATGLQHGEGVDVLTGLLNSFGITNLTNTGSYTLAVTGKLTNPNYVVNTTNSGSWTVTPATLTYVADPSTQFAGSTFSAFTGTVIGFVNGQNLASATTGVPEFTTPATASSTPGTYGIFGSGLTANHGNYVFAQAPGNATALTLNPAPANPPSQSVPGSNSSPSSQTSINFQNTNTTANFTRVSFTPSSQPGTNTANNQPNNNDVNTASLTAGDKYMHNGGRYFPPISQYDSEQYSDFKLPTYAPADSQATVLTILARGIAQANAAKYMIDGFWNGDGNTLPGEGNTWPGPGHIDLLDMATFSDGAGHDATPTNDPAFPIAAGKTDFAALLNNGPVMIGASSDPRPVQWLLATSMAPDGKGIICDDTMTGKLVELSYDPATRTVGGITKLYDDKSGNFVPLADASNDIPASDTSGLSGLQSFVPSTYFAVTVH